jgi:hypothetical protein
MVARLRKLQTRRGEQGGACKGGAVVSVCMAAARACHSMRNSFRVHAQPQAPVTLSSVVSMCMRSRTRLSL